MSHGHVISLPAFAEFFTRLGALSKFAGGLVFVSQAIFVAGWWMMESIVCCTRPPQRDDG